MYLFRCGWKTQLFFSFETDKIGFLVEDYDELRGIDLKMVDNAWRGAEAYHFLMLAQRQLYEGMLPLPVLIRCVACTFECLTNVLCSLWLFITIVANSIALMK